MQLRIALLLLVALACHPITRASMILPTSRAELVHSSGAVFRGMAVGQSSFVDPADGLIHTRTQFRVDEPLKGTFPPVVELRHRGGNLGSRSLVTGFDPQFEPDAEYLLFVTRASDGSLKCTQGRASAMRLNRSEADRSVGEFSPSDATLLNEIRELTDHGQLPGDDVTDQAGVVSAAGSGDVSAQSVTPSGLLEDGSGKSSRFLQGDAGIPIPYIVDADYLPTGITLNAATNAVKNALDAWAEVTSLQFELEGIESFGMPASSVDIDDGKLRIQLHDNYNYITETNVLGKGGRNSLSSLPTGSTWDLGGNVNGLEFRLSTHGYVVLEHTASSMQNIQTFEEVLCHEIGHALSMAHSSESTNEIDAELLEAMMYFQVHADGRGATLGTYDPPVIQQAFPTNNTPPFTGYGRRVIDATTAPSAFSITGVNEIELRSIDLQADTLSIQTHGMTTGAGAWDITGSTVKYTASAPYTAPRVAPGGGDFYDQFYSRISDGINASPWIRVKVISLNPDTYPSGAIDGIPDDWMTAYFGSPDPAAGSSRNAGDDKDTDGLTTFQEFLANTDYGAAQPAADPDDASLAQRILSFDNGTLEFQAQPWELYQLWGSTNLSTWFRVGLPLQPTNAVATVSNVSVAFDQLFIQIEKIQ